ncbi:alpha/beta fold hydrolase [Streptomyces sp. NBC_00525]|uniref:alpha/beta fold hydrolase n=1 Tax=Streptomyces sp. NBC_00525 TaxID=2903660 RepID=UPI002E7FF1F5|nr:alpha/beta hydrolase [Streptomyces sp. NBC_00525]WUC97137.1 alpha/beta hydrolase [Streptomyces sp. NBC_00525]
MTTETTRVETAGGRIDLRRVGQGRTVLFVHGLMVNGHVWDPLIAGLRDRCHMVLPDFPLGGHRDPLAPDADCSLEGHAARVLDIARQLPGPIVLVGNDTGGAIAQICVAREPELFERLVLLPSDAFDNCPPKLLVPMRLLLGIPGVVRVVGSGLRLGLAKRALMTLVARSKVPTDRIDEMLGALPSDRGVQRDFVKLLAGLRPAVTKAVAQELHRFKGPVLVVWSRKDPLFPFGHAERLAGCFSRSSVAVAEKSRAFVSLDEPEWLTERLIEFIDGGGPSHDAM